MKRTIETREEVNALCRACLKGTYEEVVSLSSNIPPNVCNSHMGTPLMYACINPTWHEAERIVAFLLSAGALYNITEENGGSALHFAAEHSNLVVVTMLAELIHFFDPKNNQGRTPLMYAAKRQDTEGLKVANFLIGKGAKITSQDNNRRTPLIISCVVGTLDMVALLGPEKHDIINSFDDVGWTPLMAATQNVYHGENIIPYLITAGANVSTVTRCSNAIILACAKNAALVRAIKVFHGPLNRRHMKHATSLIFESKRGDCADPLGIAREIGVKPAANAFKDAVERKLSTRIIWCTLRLCIPCFDGSENDYYSVLREFAPKDARLWNLVASVALEGYHPTTGDTLLHAAVRTGNPDTVAAVLRRLPNPFLRNISGQTPLDLAYTLPLPRAQIIYGLKLYSKWKPTHMCADWYGPYFCSRAKTFLLVSKRLAVLPRDLVLIILQWLASFEAV